MKTPASSLSMFADRHLLARILLGIFVSTAIVLAAIGPRSAALGLAHMPAFHPHAPDLQLIATAGTAIKLHLAAVLIALAIGVILLVGVKGTTLHRTLGWIWVVAMFTGAASSLFIRIINHGSLSLLHLFTGWTILVLPVAVVMARRHKVRVHARMMTSLFTGGLIVAGLFAFVPHRLMWDVFFG